VGAEVGEGEVQVAEAVNKAEFPAICAGEPLALHGFGRHAGAGGFHESLEHAEGGFGAVFQEGNGGHGAVAEGHDRFGAAGEGFGDFRAAGVPAAGGVNVLEEAVDPRNRN